MHSEQGSDMSLYSWWLGRHGSEGVHGKLSRMSLRELAGEGGRVGFILVYMSVVLVVERAFG